MWVSFSPRVTVEIPNFGEEQIQEQGIANGGIRSAFNPNFGEEQV